MTEARHLPALRLVLREMLADLTYAPAWKSAPWVEARLAEAGWPETVWTQLTTLALRWINTQRADVQASMKQALGEETPEYTQQEQERKARARTGLPARAQPGPSPTLEEIVPMASITVLPTLTQDSPMTEMYGDADWTELAHQARVLAMPPWEQPKDRIDKAVIAIKAGHVTLGVPATSLAYVRSEDGQRRYTVREDGCTCRATHPCYHMTAAELYRLWQTKLDAPALFPAPKTVEERLASAPETPTAVEAPSSPQEPHREAILVDPLPTPPSAPQSTPGAFRLPSQLGLRPIAAIIADLSKPVPPDCIAQIPEVKLANGRTRPAQDFLHWHTVTAILDTYAPGWEGSVQRVEKIGERCAVVYRLTLHAAEGAFSQDDSGMEDEDKDDYGDAMTNAIATALKRAAAKFGVGRLQMYDKQRKTAVFLHHAQKERQEALTLLGKTLREKGMAREEVVTWLKQQAGVTKLDEIPLAAIRTLLAYVAEHKEAQV